MAKGLTAFMQNMQEGNGCQMEVFKCVPMRVIGAKMTPYCRRCDVNTASFLRLMPTGYAFSSQNS